MSDASDQAPASTRAMLAAMREGVVKERAASAVALLRDLRRELLSIGLEEEARDISESAWRVEDIGFRAVQRIRQQGNGDGQSA